VKGREELTLAESAARGAAGARFLGLEALASLRHRDFRLLWLGSFAYFSVTIFQFFAIGKLVAVYFPRVLGPSFPILLMLGIAGLIRGASMILFAIPGGALADRFDRRRLAIITQVIAVVLVSLFSLLLAVGSIQVWQVFLLLFATSATQGFDLPARQALIPQLVGPEEVPSGVALLMGATQTSMIYTSLLSGYALDALGIAGCYALSGIGHAGLLLALLLMRPQGRPPGSRHTSTLSQIREGLRYARNDRLISSILIIVFITSAFGLAVPVTLAPYWMLRVLKLSSTTWGLMGTMTGVGMTIAAYSLSGRRGSAYSGRLFFISALAVGATIVAYGLNRSAITQGVVQVFLGASGAAVGISGATMIQTLVPNAVLGRVMSLFSLNQALPMANGITVGAFAQAVGITTAIPVIGVGLAVVVIGGAIALPSLRRHTRLESP